MIAQTIATYRILKDLGHGGPREVYLARDTELNREVVLKFLAGGASANSAAGRRLGDVVRAAAQLDHPNIVKVYKAGEHAGRPYVAMEYVTGQTLTELLAHGSIEPHEAIDIAIQICDGLGGALEIGISFRDIRPDNIFVGRGGRVRIADFGLAAGIEILRVTPAMRRFQSPERARGEDGDERSDVFSIGALLGAMDTRSRFGKIVARATSERPDDRYPTVQALAADLLDVRNRLYERATRRTFVERAFKPATAAILLGLIAASIILVKPFDRSASLSAGPSRRVVAVLPFENLGGPADDYFADGITDEITARLARLRGVGVISRTSARAYRGTQKSLGEIGEELNADYIIEGTIRWDRSHDPDRVRVTPQLIRVADDTHIWSDNYEREISEIFSVQSDIAERIAGALDLTLLEGEQGNLTAPPTGNIEAYHAYLQGMQYLDAQDFSRESFERGVRLLEHATQLDPRFALAYAKLSSIHARFYHYGFDRSDRRLARAKAAVDSAFALQPDLPEAFVALGYYYYWGRRDYERALDALNAARDRLPNNPDVMLAIAYVERRQGDLVESADLIERSIVLNPLDATAAVALGETYGTLRRYADGERALQRAIYLAPSDVYPYTELALLYLRWRGDTAAARAVLAELPPTENTEYHRARYLVELLARDYPAALECLNACPSELLEAGAFYLPIPLLEGMTLAAMGDSTRAQTAYAAALRVLEEKLAEYPDDYRVQSALALADAGLGRTDDAVRHGERAIALYPISKDALEAPVLIIDLALTYTMVGRYDAALDKLDEILSIPSILSAAWLEKDPRWDPLRRHPRFETLLAEHRIGKDL